MTAVREARCDRSDLPVSMCAHCRKQALDFDPADLDDTSFEDRADDSEYGPPFQARYPGRCSECDQRIHEGDTIRAAVLAGGWVHAGCAS